MKQFNISTIKKSFTRANFVRNLNGFTLIEILVVATIISLLAAGGMVSYSSITKNSLNARRKTDLEYIRAAIEIYRTNVSGYPPTITFKCPFGSLTDGTKIPNDPKCQSGKSYSYTASPNPCDNSSTYCISYILTAILEDNSNYIVNPYGTEVITPTPTP
jgi:general secretion pathway protein G